MARLLTKEPNTVLIHDNLSGSEIEFRFNMPTTKQRTGFQNMAVKRTRNKVEFKNVEARRKYGLEILCGIRKDDFEIMKDGEKVTFTSDPGEFYDENWKDHVEEHAIDLVELLGAHVFEASCEVNGDGQD